MKLLGIVGQIVLIGILLILVVGFGFCGAIGLIAGLPQFDGGIVFLGVLGLLISFILIYFIILVFKGMQSTDSKIPEDQE